LIYFPQILSVWGEDFSPFTDLQVVTYLEGGDKVLQLIGELGQVFADGLP
jgi:hypothetical protein